MKKALWFLLGMITMFGVFGIYGAGALSYRELLVEAKLSE